MSQTPTYRDILKYEILKENLKEFFKFKEIILEKDLNASVMLNDLQDYPEYFFDTLLRSSKEGVQFILDDKPDYLLLESNKEANENLIFEKFRFVSRVKLTAKEEILRVCEEVSDEENIILKNPKLYGVRYLKDNVEITLKEFLDFLMNEREVVLDRIKDLFIGNIDIKYSSRLDETSFNVYGSTKSERLSHIFLHRTSRYRMHFIR